MANFYQETGWLTTPATPMWANNFNATFSSGFQVSEPTNDPATVRNQLNYFHSAYPNQLFTVDNCQSDKSKVVVSWIPVWFIPIWINGLFSQALYASISPSWPESGSTIAWPGK
jgi:hypothetical protein